VDDSIKSALLGSRSSLQPFYRLMQVQESGEWQEAAELSRQLGLKENEAADSYWQAVQWARQVTAG
jgi:EAL and modified HD-GYP domain-containing signal transduction protein